MTKTILVIEDDKSVLLLLEDVLKSEGFDVRVERDGEWGLRTFQERNVDLVIVDVLIPKIKGFDLITKLRETEKGKNLPIIVISGVYRAANHKERIVQKHRVVEYLDKPVDIDRLIDSLHDVFSSAYPVPPKEAGEQAAPPKAAPGPTASTAVPHPSPAVVAAQAAKAGAIASAAAASSAAASAAASLASTVPGPPPVPKAEIPVAPVVPVVPLVRKDSIPSDPSTLGVPDRGTLEVVPFARLLGGLFAARVTGQLLLKKGSVKKIVYLRQGIPVFVKSNLVTECLGRVMVSEKLISEEECTRSLERKKASGKRQGEVLVEMGSISPHNLEFALELQLQTKLYDMFSWMEGEYQFVPKDDFSGQAVALSLGPTAMIYEGASRTMSAERLERDLERLHELAVVPAKDPTFRYQALELDPRAERLLDRIDGRRSVKKLLESADFDIEDAALLMYALSCTGLLQTVGVATEPMAIDDDDIQVLSTNEIDPAAELAKLVAPQVAPAEAPKSHDAATAFGSNTPGSWALQIGPATGIVQPAPLPAAPIAPIAPIAASAPSSAEPLIAARTVHVHPPTEIITRTPSPLPPPPPPPDSDTSIPALNVADLAIEHAAPSVPPIDRAQPPTERFSPQIEAPAIVLGAPEVPALSAELRRQVRARLDAEAAKLISQRPQAAPIPSSAPKKVPSSPKAPPKKEAPKLDLERDHARTKKELSDTLDRLMRADLYEVLGVSRRASAEDLERSHQKLTRDHHPDRVLAGSSSRELRSISERIVIVVERAYDVLANKDARKSYDRSIGLENGDTRIAPLISAEQAFARGKDLLDKSEFAAAREAFFDATEKSPGEGTYFAYLGLAMFLTAPKDENTKRVALEALDKALELAPLNEEVYLFRGTIQQKAGNRTEAVREYERALRCNPDSVPALEALRTLEPPTRPKTGLFSRLTSS